MLISHRNRFLFVHIYKNAGSAISAALEPWAGHAVCDLPFHLTAVEIRDQIGRSAYPLLNANPGAWFEYFSFAVVRNPFEWLVSLYHWLLQEEAHDLQPFARRLGSFQAFIAWLADPEAEQPASRHGSQAAYRRPQSAFVCDAEGRIIVSRILRFEFIEKEFHATCAELGIPATLRHTNRSQHPPYRECYDDSTRERVHRLYQSDLNLFGYDF